MGIFHGDVLAQKKGHNSQKLDLKSLGQMVGRQKLQGIGGAVSVLAGL